MQFKFLHQNYVIPPHNSITPPPIGIKISDPPAKTFLKFYNPKAGGGGGLNLYLSFKSSSFST